MHAFPTSTFYTIRSLFNSFSLTLKNIFARLVLCILLARPASVCIVGCCCEHRVYTYTYKMFMCYLLVLVMVFPYVAIESSVLKGQQLDLVNLPFGHDWLLSVKNSKGRTFRRKKAQKNSHAHFRNLGTIIYQVLLVSTMLIPNILRIPGGLYRHLSPHYAD